MHLSGFYGTRPGSDSNVAKSPPQRQFPASPPLIAVAQRLTAAGKRGSGTRACWHLPDVAALLLLCTISAQVPRSHCGSPRAPSRPPRWESSPKRLATTSGRRRSRAASRASRYLRSTVGMFRVQSLQTTRGKALRFASSGGLLANTSGRRVQRLPMPKSQRSSAIVGIERAGTSTENLDRVTTLVGGALPSPQADVRLTVPTRQSGHTAFLHAFLTASKELLQAGNLSLSTALCVRSHLNWRSALSYGVRRARRRAATL